MEIIAREGRLDISDGISIYTFKNDGTFTLVPLFEGGRYIVGTWEMIKKEPACLCVDGEWRWIKGYRIPTDRRSILIDISPIEGKKIKFVKGEVYKSTFTIHTTRRALSLPLRHHWSPDRGS